MGDDDPFPAFYSERALTPLCPRHDTNDRRSRRYSLASPYWNRQAVCDMDPCTKILGLPKAVSHNGVGARLGRRAQSVLQKTLDISTLHLHVFLSGVVLKSSVHCIGIELCYSMGTKGLLWYNGASPDTPGSICQSDLILPLEMSGVPLSIFFSSSCLPLHNITVRHRLSNRPRTSPARPSSPKVQCKICYQKICNGIIANSTSNDCVMCICLKPLYHKHP